MRMQNGGKKMKTKKCCKKNCENEAEGFYVTTSSGLWLCKKHSYGKKEGDIKEVRDNFKMKYLWDMEINKEEVTK